jgi:hypothetical protein
VGGQRVMVGDRGEGVHGDATESRRGRRHKGEPEKRMSRDATKNREEERRREEGRSPNARGSFNNTVQTSFVKSPTNAIK